MNPDHIETLRRALVTVETPEVRDTLAEFLMTGELPEIERTIHIMPGMGRMHERYIVHYLRGASRTITQEYYIREINNFLSKHTDGSIIYRTPLTT